MTGAAYMFGLVVAAVFFAAGTAKAMRPNSVAEEFGQLGIPAPRAFARVLPIVEVAAAAALVLSPRIGAVVALGLLTIFSIVVVKAMRRRSGLRCGCFGASRGEELSWRHVLRNALLAVAAAICLVRAQRVVPSMDAVIVTTTAAVTAALVLALIRMKAQLGTVWDNTLAGEVLREEEQSV